MVRQSTLRCTRGVRGQEIPWSTNRYLGKTSLEITLINDVFLTDWRSDLDPNKVCA